MHVAAVEALRKKERGDEPQITTKIGGKTSSLHEKTGKEP
jgi:hypothetical protein